MSLVQNLFTLSVAPRANNHKTTGLFDPNVWRGIFRSMSTVLRFTPVHRYVWALARRLSTVRCFRTVPRGESPAAALTAQAKSSSAHDCFHQTIARAPVYGNKLCIHYFHGCVFVDSAALYYHSRV